MTEQQRPKLARTRVLIADDNIDIQEMLGEFFADEGFEVVHAYDGEEAIRKTAEVCPSLVLLDMRMPREDGLQVLRRIRETDLETAIVLHTAFGNDSLALEALGAGADDYLKKPVQLDHLLERVHAVLTAKEGHNELRHRAEQRLRESEERYRTTAADLAARVATIEVTQEVARSVLSNLELYGVADTVVTQLRRLLPYERAAMVLLEADGTQGHVLASFDSAAAEPWPKPREDVALQDGLLRAVVSDRKLLRVTDLSRTADLGRFDRELVSAGIQSLMILPVVARERVAGVMYLGAREPGVFTERHEAVAQELIAPVGIAMQNALLYRELHESYANLERAQEELLRQERLAALGQIAAVMAHELRNPLAVIFNSLGPMRQIMKPEGDAAMLLTIVEEESDRLNRIVGSLLDYARPTTLQMTEGNLTALLFDVVRDARTDSAYDPSIEVLTDYSHGAGPLAFDEHLLRQALINLLQNAFQAVRKEGRVWLRTADLDVGGKPYVRISITDTGGGIRTEIRDRIFDPFFTTRATGTGLGLPIVKRVVEDHRGQLQLDTRPGEGTTFAVLLPRGPARPLQVRSPGAGPGN